MGAGLNLIRTSFMPLEWPQKIKSFTSIRYMSASDDPITVCGTILMSIGRWHLKVRVHFLLVDNLAVWILIGTSYMDQCIRGIFAMERLIVPVHSAPGVILLACAPDIKSILIVDFAENTKQLWHPSATAFGVAKQVCIFPNTELVVHVRRLQAGLHKFPLHPNVLKSLLTLMASAMVDTVPYKSFGIFPTNVSTKWTRFPLYMLVAVETYWKL